MLWLGVKVEEDGLNFQAITLKSDTNSGTTDYIKRRLNKEGKN